MTHLDLSREALYELVWSTPMQHLAKRFKFSDRAIAKHCARKQVPVPWRGYWAKKLAKGNLEIPKLPAFIEKKLPRKPRLAIEASQPVFPVPQSPRVNPIQKVPDARYLSRFEKVARQNLSNFRREVQEVQDYEIIVSDWLCSYSLGLNRHYDPFKSADKYSFRFNRIYREYERLSVKGKCSTKGLAIFDKPVEVVIYASKELQSDIREKQWEDLCGLPSSVGDIRKSEEGFEAILNVPTDAMVFVRDMILSRELKVVRLSGARLIRGSAMIFSFNFEQDPRDN